MGRLRNHVRRELLEVSVASEPLAFTLRPRLVELNRLRLLPAIERVLSEVTVDGRHFRIDRLDLDLGAFLPADIEQAEERLVRELRRSLEMRFGEAKTWRTEEDVRRELLELYLLHGAWPRWASDRHVFSLEAFVLEMADADPDGLVEVMRGAGQHDYVLERVAAQLGDAAMRRLIRLLEPRHAALLLDYVDDLEDVHRTEPLLPMSDRDLSRVVWVLVQSYLVQDPGSHFNRKSFVRSLLEGLAASEGLEYAQILAALRVGLDRTERRHPLGSSLPAIVAELVQELSDTAEPEPLFGALAALVTPREAEAMNRFLEILQRIPSPYRPRPEDRLRQVLLAAVLDLGDGARLDESFYASVLAELFAWPLAEPVSRFLFEVAESGDGLADDQREAFRAAVAAASRTPQSNDELRRQARDRRTRERWASELSEEELMRLAETLEPQRHRQLLATADVLATAWRETAPPGHPALTERRAFWSFLLGFLARNPAAGHSIERLVTAFFEDSAARYLAVSADTQQVAVHGELLLERAGRLARTGGHIALAGILHRGGRILLTPWEEPRTVPRPGPRRSTRKRVPDEPAEDARGAADIYIDNAGLVLAAPFLPQLFTMLELVTEREEKRPAIAGFDAISRAVHLLQFLVDGRTSAPEPLLVLNKILCGVPPATPVDRGIDPTERERETCGTLLRSIIAGWKVIERTSIEGLQTSFLQREGKLRYSADGWKLEVQRKTIDCLVDEIPWNHSLILLRWMREPLHVSW